MFQYNLDPIAFLENANAEFPYLDQPQHNAAPELSADETQARSQILKLAQLYVESPYLFGGTGSLPGEPTDCSQYTKTIYAQAGIQLDRNSADQAVPFAGGGYRYDSIEKAKI